MKNIKTILASAFLAATALVAAPEVKAQNWDFCGGSSGNRFCVEHGRRSDRVGIEVSNRIHIFDISCYGNGQYKFNSYGELNRGQAHQFVRNYCINKVGY